LTLWRGCDIIREYRAFIIMPSVQLAPNLRYVSLSDDDGVFGLFVVHEGDQVRYTIEVTNYDEFRATVESFQEQPA